MKVSIFIPTKNAGVGFTNVLKAIFSQAEKKFEVIIVDSGSTDETLSIASQFPVSIYNISSHDFSHGKTRNLALQYAKGEYIVFVSQDAIPASPTWLSSLLTSCSDTSVAGAFSRQIPYEGSSIMEHYFYATHFPTVSRISHPKEVLGLTDIFFSNASSIVRKDVLASHPFNDTIIMSEDQEWAHRMLQQGYSIAYAADSVISHSHNYNLIQTMKRYFDSAYSLKQIIETSFLTTGLTYITKETFYTALHAPYHLPGALLNTIFKIIGTALGLSARYLPTTINIKLSMHAYYWQRKLASVKISSHN